MYALMYECMYGQTYSKSMDRPGKVAIPARGQLDLYEVIMTQRDDEI